MNKEIVFVKTSGVTSGVYRVQNQLIEEWRKQGHIVNIISSNGRVIEDTLGLTEIQPECQEPHFILMKIRNRFIRLQRFFKMHPNATIVALSVSADCFAALFGKTVKNRVVISERNDPAQYPESGLYRSFRNFCFRLADACIFQTADAMKYFPVSVQRKGTIIPNPINPDIPAFNDIKKEKIVVSSGRLKEQKNFPLLINAFAKFYQTHKDYRLRIYGNGPLHDELIDYAKQLGLETIIEIHDFTNDIYPIVARAGMFVMSSNYEGISNSMLEALAIGTPTICTDCPVGGARQMIENNVNGILVPVGDAEALAEAMCRVADDPEFALRISENGKKIREKYPIEKIAARWIDVMWNDNLPR